MFVEVLDHPCVGPCLVGGVCHLPDAFADVCPDYGILVRYQFCGFPLFQFYDDGFHGVVVGGTGDYEVHPLGGVGDVVLQGDECVVGDFRGVEDESHPVEGVLPGPDLVGGYVSVEIVDHLGFYLVGDDTVEDVVDEG